MDVALGIERPPRGSSRSFFVRWHILSWLGYHRYDHLHVQIIVSRRSEDCALSDLRYITLMFLSKAFHCDVPYATSVD